MQRQDRIAEQSGGKPLHQAKELARKLAGMGPFSLQMDGCRVTAPARLIDRLGDLAHENWRFTRWLDPRIRIIPEGVWKHYLARVQRGFTDAAIARKTLQILEQSSESKTLDSRARWDVPVDLQLHANLKSSAVLVVNEFWLELLSPENWRRQVEETWRRAQEVYKPLAQAKPRT